MTASRLEQLLEFYKEDSSDPFTIYAIATEYLKIDIEKSRYYYELLLAEHADYVGTYYHAGKLYEQLGEKDKAGAVYKKGMQVSREMGQMHAFSELQQAYNKFMGLDFDED
jgi:tetratricopeptide (TPR) repeat protein